MATPVTTKQMGLLVDLGRGSFMERLQATIAQAATSILSEPGSTPFHAGRAAYAQRVVQGPATAATQAGPQVVMGVNVVNTTVIDENTGKSVCSILDIDLQSQVLTLWNALAGLDTPS